MPPDTLVISGRSLAKKRKPLFADFSVPLPPHLDEDGGGLTLRALITQIVAAEVEAFKGRQSERQLVKVLSAARIEEGVKKGKIDAGGHDLNQKVDTDAAVAAALQAFEDGLYLVVIDDIEQRNLDAHVYVRPGSRVTFIRLVFLAGA